VYSKGGGFGTSTYRLLNKSGDFIFLRTHGHLEYDKETNKPVSFICINTLLTDDEGWKGLEIMKKRFSAKVKQEAIMPGEEAENVRSVAYIFHPGINFDFARFCRNPLKMRRVKKISNQQWNSISWRK